MNRRGFFGALSSVVAGAAVAQAVEPVVTPDVQTRSVPPVDAPEWVQLYEDAQREAREAIARTAQTPHGTPAFWVALKDAESAQVTLDAIVQGKRARDREARALGSGRAPGW